MDPAPPNGGLPAVVYTVAPDALVSGAARVMAHHAVGDVVVVEGEVPVGILTDRDILRRVTSRGLDPGLVAVRQVMSTPLVTVARSEEVEAAVHLMGRHGIRRLPIVDETGRLVSILTLDDLLLCGLAERPALREIVARQLGVREGQAPPPAGPLTGRVDGVARAAVAAPDAWMLQGPHLPRWLGRDRIFGLLVALLIGATLALLLVLWRSGWFPASR